MNTDSRQLLLGNLISCFPKQAQQIDNRWTVVFYDVLPPTMTEEQSRLLSNRLIARYHFLPTIAEILEEWRALVREERLREALPVAASAGKTNPVILNFLRKVRSDVKAGKRFPKPKVTPELMEFARLFFPEISEAMVQRNWLEIMNCKTEREKEMEENSRYRTIMKMMPDGNIELMMRKVA
jgi:hypothetical protein